MKLLVTGGAGFIGSNFIRHILASQPEVRVLNLDCLSYAGNLENLDDLTSDSRLTFQRGDIACPEDVEKCFGQGLDGVINFAAETHVDRSILDSAAFVRTNISGTHVLLEACRRHRVAPFVQVSTDEVYGSLGTTGRFTEESPIAPNSPYAASKAGADLLVRSYCRTYGLHAVIARCSNNYGPYQFPEKLIPLMVLNALEGKPLPVYGDGLYTRDWIHVQDHCRALERVLARGRPGAVYNIGGDQEKTNLEVVRLILEMLEKPHEEIQFVEDRPGHDRRYAMEIARIRSELDWNPEMPFESGLQQTVRWYREHQGWVKRVRNGAYRGYYRRMYEQRGETLSDL